MTAAEDQLAKARARLVETLSGRKPLKLNASPLSNGYQEFAEIVKRNAAAQIRLNASKKELVETLSHGTKHDGFDDGIKLMEIPADLLQKQTALKKELCQRLAGQNRTVKQNRCPYTNNSTGKKITTDSPITPTGVPFVGRYGYITARNGSITLDQLLAEEQDKADEDSPSSAVVSGQTGTANWSPDTAQDDYVSDWPFDADRAKSDLLTHYKNKNGEINGYAKRYFLNVLGDGSEPNPDNFQIPLGQINAAQQPYYDSDALLEAWKHAAGIYNAAANRSLQLRLVRIMRRNGFTLTPDMQQFATKYMGEKPPETDDDEDNQEE